MPDDSTPPEPAHELPRSGRARRVLARLTLVVVSLVLTDLAAGLLLLPGDVGNFRQEHPWFHHGLVPNTLGRSQWGTGEEYPLAVNSLGFVDRRVRDVPLKSSRRRILFLGDSFTEGIGMPFERSFVGLLEERFAARDVEVLNAAVMSFSPKLYRLRLEHLLEKVGLRFDELVLLIDISDIQDQVLYRKFTPREESTWERARHWAWGTIRQTSFTVNSVDAYLHARERQELRKKYNADVYPPWLDYFWLDNRDTEPYRDPAFPHIRSDWPSDALFENPWTDLGIALALEDMQAVVELCREHDVELTLGVYPWPKQIWNGEFESRQVFLWESFCAPRGLGFINLFDDFMPTPDYSAEEVYTRYYIDGDVHWSAAGHELVADAIEAYLTR